MAVLVVVVVVTVVMGDAAAVLVRVPVLGSSNLGSRAKDYFFSPQWIDDWVDMWTVGEFLRPEIKGPGLLNSPIW